MVTMQKDDEKKVRENYAAGFPCADYDLLTRLEGRLSDDDAALGAYTRALLTARLNGKHDRRGAILGVYAE